MLLPCKTHNKKYSGMEKCLARRPTGLDTTSEQRRYRLSSSDPTKLFVSCFAVNMSMLTATMVRTERPGVPESQLFVPVRELSVVSRYFAL